MQVRPDDPAWLTTAPDIRLVDLQVLRQAGVPEPLLFLALREKRSASVSGRRTLALDPRGGSGLDVAFLDEFEEDPDKRPYAWDLPDDCI